MSKTRGFNKPLVLEKVEGQARYVTISLQLSLSNATMGKSCWNSVHRLLHLGSLAPLVQFLLHVPGQPAGQLHCGCAGKTPRGVCLHQDFLDLTLASHLMH